MSRTKRGSETPRRQPPAPLLAAALVAATLLLYGQTRTFDFVRADDTDLIVENFAFISDPANLGRVFRQSYFEVTGRPEARKTYYRPIVIASFMLDAQRGGSAPASYHATNVAIHAAATVLLFAWLLVLGAPRLPAFLLSLVFAVHPLNAQAVSWVPGRNDTLLAVFGLASLLALARSVEARGGPTAGRSLRNIGGASLQAGHPAGGAVWNALHVAGFALALFTKETAVVLLPLFALYVWLWKKQPGYYRRHPALVAAYVVVVTVWFALRRSALAGSSDTVAPGQYLDVVLANLPGLLLYAGKALAPYKLNTMPAVTTTGVVLGVAAVAAFGWLLIGFVERGRALFAATWFLLVLAPGLVVVGLPVYEHRAYFALMGLSVGLAFARPIAAVERAASPHAMAIVAVAIVFFAVSFRHADVFRDPFRYWESATRDVEYAPLAHVNLGQLHEGRDQLDRAESHYRQALAIDPTTPGASNNLGVVMMKRGRPQEAEGFFKEEIARHPTNVDARFNLGLYYELADRPDEAAREWRASVELDPTFLPGYEKLVEYHRRRGDERAAAQYIEKARGLTKGQ